MTYKKKRISTRFIATTLGFTRMKVTSHAEMCPEATQEGEKWSFPDNNSTWMYFDRVLWAPEDYSETDYMNDLSDVSEKGLLTVPYLMVILNMSAFQVISNAPGSPGSCRVGGIRAFDNSVSNWDYYGGIKQ